MPIMFNHAQTLEPAFGTTRSLHWLPLRVNGDLLLVVVRMMHFIF